MKKIVVLNGSPHEHGSTSALADEVIKAAKLQGAEVKSYYLNGMSIKGCQGCGGCKTQQRCVIQDDMQPLYDEIAEASGIVFATPVYMWQISAQLKLAYDRLYAFLKPGHVSRLAPGKKVLLLATQGRKDAARFRHYFDYMREFLAFFGFGEHRILIAGGTHRPEDVLCQCDVLAEAEQMGTWLCQ